MTLSPVKIKSLATKITLSIGCIFIILLLSISLLYSHLTFQQFDNFLTEQDNLDEPAENNVRELQNLSDLIKKQLFNISLDTLLIKFDQLIKSNSQYSKKYLIVLTNLQGRVIASNMPLSENSRVIKNGEEIIFQSFGKENFELAQTGIPLLKIRKDKDAIAHLAIFFIEEDELEQLANEFEFSVLEYISILFIIFMLLGLIFFRWIVQYYIAPLETLKTATLSLQEGQYPEQISVAGDDEISQLTHHFNGAFYLLKKQEISKKQMISDIAHELRTPLTNMAGKFSAIQDGLLKVDENTIKKLSTDIKHLIRLIQDLQDLSLAQSGVLKIHPEITDLCIETQTVIDSFGERNLPVTFNIINKVQPGLEIYTDKVRLRQILINLIDNALKYAIAEIEVIIVSECTGNKTGLKVIDNGKGISEEKISHIFERYIRVEDQRHDKNNEHNFGLGLGLSIVKHLALIQGADIEVSSRPGHTEFTVWFAG